MLQMVRRLIRNLNSSSGFSLLEVMLAILLLGTGFALLLQVVSTGLFASGVNENELIAANLTQEKIEELRNTQYAGIAQETPAVAVTGFPAFTREVLVSTPQTGLKQITVNVYYYVKNTQTNTAMVSYVSDI